MKSPFIRILLFLVLNFGALALGALFTNSGVNSEWYQNIAKAPWTPPGWFFGFAWTSIMICFSIYLSSLWNRIENHKKLLRLFALQWLLNVSWNPAFFYFQQVSFGLLIISALTILVAYFLFHYRPEMKSACWWISPYFVWLLVATSLNAYILVFN